MAVDDAQQDVGRAMMVACASAGFDVMLSLVLNWIEVEEHPIIPIPISSDLHVVKNRAWHMLPTTWKCLKVSFVSPAEISSETSF